jgi:hypothetical protein
VRQGPWVALLALAAWLHLAQAAQGLVGPGQLCLASCLQDHLGGPGPLDQAAWEEVSAPVRGSWHLWGVSHPIHPWQRGTTLCTGTLLDCREAGKAR